MRRFVPLSRARSLSVLFPFDWLSLFTFLFHCCCFDLKFRLRNTSMSAHKPHEYGFYGFIHFTAKCNGAQSEHTPHNLSTLHWIGLGLFMWKNATATATIFYCANRLNGKSLTAIKLSTKYTNCDKKTATRFNLLIQNLCLIILHFQLAYDSFLHFNCNNLCVCVFFWRGKISKLRILKLCHKYFEYLILHDWSVSHISMATVSTIACVQNHRTNLLLIHLKIFIQLNWHES